MNLDFGKVMWTLLNPYSKLPTIWGAQICEQELRIPSVMWRSDIDAKKVVSRYFFSVKFYLQFKLLRVRFARKKCGECPALRPV